VGVGSSVQNWVSDSDCVGVSASLLVIVLLKKGSAGPPVRIFEACGWVPGLWACFWLNVLRLCNSAFISDSDFAEGLDLRYGCLDASQNGFNAQILSDSEHAV